MVRMGSPIEINDTLKISKERGFPECISLDDHLAHPDKSFELVRGKVFDFWNPDERLYPRLPTRAFLVEEISGDWLYWGHVHIREQTISANKTRGKFEIVTVYDPLYQYLATLNEAPKHKAVPYSATQLTLLRQKLPELLRRYSLP